MTLDGGFSTEVIAAPFAIMNPSANNPAFPVPTWRCGRHDVPHGRAAGRDRHVDRRRRTGRLTTHRTDPLRARARALLEQRDGTCTVTAFDKEGLT
ncbi:hypothetical protein [Burkholderia sp. BCC1998]|uniref:hypothetical protein n=1 Tax=Burkholderia sp. BCC1998 TaxID=2817447 RepID=UPI002AB66593|nr:hypothetical protein [Burkholderia sp. BCC1998]